MMTLKEIETKFAQAEDNGHEETIISNDIKKGMPILMKSGWYGEMIDNARGNIRLASIYGYNPNSSDLGSVYVWDIGLVVKDNKLCRVLLTDKQRTNKSIVNAMGF